jgi:2-hydroxychromene-2-carboxylate isomerase
LKIEFWFDFASTYSYPTVMRIEQLAEKENLTVVWRPFLCGAIFNKQGWNDSPFNIFPAKGKYMWRDMERICEDQGLPYKRPTVFPQNGLLASRIVTRFSEEQWVPTFIRSVFLANFECDRDISSLEVISDCLSLAGQNVDSILNEANSQSSKQRLRAQTDEAIERNIFGAPSFFVGDELFWGNDRLERAITWAKSA